MPPFSSENVTDVAQAIQLAVAPVLLLTGIAGLLNVMAGRLSRIVDRGRVLGEERSFDELSEHHRFELLTLERRRHLTSVAITACTISVLLLCIVVAILFIEVMLNAPLSWLIGALFISSTLTLVVGLSYFLREVNLATRTVRVQMPTRATNDRKAQRKPAN